jgi:hypothetical protein
VDPPERVERLDPSQRVVIRGPLEALWDEEGHDLNLRRVRQVGAEDIRGLLRSGRPVPFVLANLGERLRWIRGDERFDFWKSELRPHMAEPGSRWRLEDFPDEYRYVATEWRWEHEETAFCVLCETYH